MLYTCVRNLLDKRFGQIPKKRGLPMASQGQSAPNWHNCTVPAQGFAQRPCLRFHVRQANPNSNLCAQCAHGPPNNIGMQVPCDPRTVCQTPKTRGCPMIRARPAKVNSNLGAQCARGPAKRHCNASALCSTQGLPNPKETQGPMIHARSAKQRCDAGARRKQHYEATRLAYENTLQFSQKQLLSDCFSKRFQVFSKAKLKT